MTTSSATAEEEPVKLLRLSANLKPTQAYLIRGVLQEHGIPAFVWLEHSGTFYGEDTWGGCSLMVDASLLEDAHEILDAPSGPLPDDATFTSDSRQLIGSLPGIPLMIVMGAVLAPLVPLVSGLLSYILAYITATPANRGVLLPPQPQEIMDILRILILDGMIGGALVGILFLPLEAYRRDSAWGRFFVRCVAILLII